MKHTKIRLAAAVMALAVLAAGCSSGSARHETAVSSEAARYDAVTEAPMAAPQANFSADYSGEMDSLARARVAEDSVADEQIVESGVEYETAEPATGGGEVMPELPIDVPSIETDNRKIVYTVDLSLQTTEFDEGVKRIPEMVEGAGGFVQDSYVQGNNIGERYYSRAASFTVRVPVEKLNIFTDELGGIFHVVSQQKSSSDISNSYYDTKARLDSLRIQEERLKAMLETADELQYLLEVERELAQVLYEIESMTSSLRRMDSSVNLSTITIHLQEVTTIDENQPEPKPITFGDRVSETFGDSLDGFVEFCQSIALFFIALIPFLPVMLVIALVIWLLVRAARKRRAKRPARPKAAYPPQAPYPLPPQQAGPQNPQAPQQTGPQQAPSAPPAAQAPDAKNNPESQSGKK